MSEAEPAAAVERTFDVVFECDAVNDGRMRTEMVARMVEPDRMEFALATDEGDFHGGDGSAPTPLMLFAGGLASCLMTQLRAFSKRLRIEAGAIRLSTRLHWQGRQRGREPYVTAPVGFEIDIEIDGAASDADKLRLIEAAKNGCFGEQTLARPNTIRHRLKAGNDWLDA
jgi:uncharacterized OsmC-like protein